LSAGIECGVGATLLLPIYKVAEWLLSTHERARRLGLVTLEQMLNALVVAVKNPVAGIQVITVPEIRNASV
jgi:hypothetical protein